MHVFFIWFCLAFHLALCLTSSVRYKGWGYFTLQWTKSTKHDKGCLCHWSLTHKCIHPSESRWYTPFSKIYGLNCQWQVSQVFCMWCINWFPRVFDHKHCWIFNICLDSMIIFSQLLLLYHFIIALFCQSSQIHLWKYIRPSEKAQSENFAIIGDKILI